MITKKLKSNIRSFIIGSKNIFITTDNKILLNNEILFQCQETLQELHSSEKEFYTNTINGDGVIIFNKEVKYLQNEFIRQIDKKFIITFENGKTKILSKETNSQSLKPFRIFKFIIKKNTNRFIYYEGSVFDLSNHKILCSNILNDDIYFSFSLSSLNNTNNGSVTTPYQVSEFCDIYNNTLISTMTNGDILLLDIEKGEPIKLFKDTKVLGGLFQKEENSSIYIGLKFKTYIEIDVEKSEIIKKIDLEEYFKQKFNRTILVPINTTVYQKGLIYFIADTNIVGVFDPEKTEVIDFYEFKFENKQTMLKGGKENLQVKDNNVYCLDNQDNLYTLNLTPPSPH